MPGLPPSRAPALGITGPRSVPCETGTHEGPSGVFRELTAIAWQSGSLRVYGHPQRQNQHPDQTPGPHLQLHATLTWLVQIGGWNRLSDQESARQVHHHNVGIIPRPVKNDLLAIGGDIKAIEEETRFKVRQLPLTAGFQVY